MKKLLSLVIVMGFAIMLGAAGGADTAEVSFAAVLLLELLGMAIVLFGTSALMHYKRYMRRNAHAHMSRQRNTMPEKELC